MRHLAAIAPVQFPRPRHGFQFPLQSGDLLRQDPPVGLDLGFARAAQEADTAALPFQVGPGADQPALLIGKMGEFDLQAAFAGGRALAENLQDQAGAVDHLGFQVAFQIALLHGRERAIHDHHVDTQGIDGLAQVFDLARPEPGGRADTIHRGFQRIDHIERNGRRQADRFLKPGSRQAQGRTARLVAGGLAPHIGMNNDGAPCRLAVLCRGGRIKSLAQWSRGASPACGSNNWIGAAGITVEMACL